MRENRLSTEREPQASMRGGIGKMLLIAVIYFMFARLSLAFVVQPEGLAIIWPPSGFALAVLLLLPRSSWSMVMGFIFVSNFAANALTGHSAPLCFGFALANSLESLLGAFVLTKTIGASVTFTRVKDYVGVYVICAGVTTALTAALGATLLTAGQGVEAFWPAWQIWWVSDAVGIVIVTPLLVTLWTSRPSRGRITPPRLLEAGLMVMALLTITLISYYSFSGLRLDFVGNYVVFPILGWAALRFGPRGAAIVTALFAVLTVFFTIQGYGPFYLIEHSAKDNVLALQLFLAIFSLGGGLLAGNSAERRTVKEDLQRSEKRFRSLFELSNDAIIIHDNAGHFLDINERAVEMLGYSREELLARTLIDCHSPAVVDDARSAFYTLQISGHVRYDTKFLKKDGSSIDVELSAGIVDPGSSVFQVHVHDITERVQKEMQIRSSEERFRNIWDRSFDGMRLTDEHGTMVMVNAAFCRQVGMAPEALEGQPMKVIYDTLDGARIFEPTLERIRARSVVPHFEHQVHLWNGRAVWFELSNSFVELGSGKNYLLSIFRDITGRKNAEQSAAQLAAIVQSSDDIIISKTLEGIITSWNKGAESIYGYTESEMVGQHVATLAPAECAGDIPPILESIRKGVHVRHFETTRMRKDGRTFDVSLTVSPIRDAQGMLIGASTVGRDITERKQAEQSIRENETILRAILNHSKDAIGLSIGWHHVFSNPAYIALFGYTSNNDLAERTVLDLIAPSERERVAGYQRRPKDDSSAPTSYETRGLRSDGTEFYMDVTVSEMELQGKTYELLLLRDITERTRAARELARNEGLLRESQIIAGLGSYRLDIETGAWDSSEVLDDLFGIDDTFPRTVSGWGSLIHPDDRPMMLNYFTEDVAGRGVTFDKEYRIIRENDRAERWVHGLGRLDVDTNGRPVVMHGTIQDITHRKQVEDALRENEQQLKLFIEHTPAAIAMFDTDMNYVIASRRWYQDYGLGDQSIVGRSHYEVFPEITDRWKEIHHRCLAGAIERCEEDPFPRVDGRTDWVRWEIRPWRNSKNAIGGIIMFTEVITERRQAQEALRESEKRYRQFFEEDLTGDFISSADGTLISCNAAFARIYGFRSVDEAMHSSMYELYPNREARESYLDLLRAKRKLEYYEEEARRMDGTALFLVSNIIGEFDEQGNLQQMRGYIFDNTERKKLEDQLRYTQKLESIGTLAGGIAHDFNNLLNAVLGQSALALDKLPRESPAGNNVTKAIKAAERAADLTRQLLAYSGKGKFITEMIDLNVLIRENLQMLEVSIPKTAQLRVNLGLPPPVIRGDVGQIQQVIMNLIINAGDAIGAGRGYIMICTSRMEITQHRSVFEEYTQEPLVPGSYAMLQVMDTGCGMNETILSRIFDPFFTTKFSGRGLGLAAVLGIIRGHHGGMRITSVEGKGTTFEILFPMAAHEIKPPPVEPPGSDSLDGDGKTILVIDDESFVLELLTDILTAANFTVLTASNPLQGIEMFRHHNDSISLVVLDYSMPEMDGRQAFAELLKIDENVPVLMCSGYTEDEVEAVFGEARPRGFVHKPYKPDLLLSHVGRILSERALRT